MVSTSVCGTESSGSNPDRDLLFDVHRLSMSKRPFIFSSFSYPGTQWYIVLLLVPISRTRNITFPFLLSKTILFLFSKDRFLSAEYSFRFENPLPI